MCVLQSAKQGFRCERIVRIEAIISLYLHQFSGTKNGRNELFRGLLSHARERLPRWPAVFKGNDKIYEVGRL